MTAAILIAGLIGVWLAGHGLSVLLCDAGDDDAGRTERCGLALPLGIAAHAGAMFVWSFAGGALTSGLSWTLTLASVALGLAVLGRRRQRRIVTEPVGAAARVPGATLARGCRWIVALLLFGTLALAVLTPQRFWDERAIFGIKSKVLFTVGTLHSPALEHPDFVQGHPRYPLLIPLAETHVYLLLGRIDDRWSKTIFPVLFAGMVLAYAGRLTRRFGPGCGWLFALLLASVPLFAPYELGFITGQGDAPVACYHGLAAMYAWDWLRGGGVSSWLRRGVLIGALAAAAAFTKDEGIAHLLVGVIALGITWGWRCLVGRGLRTTADGGDAVPRQPASGEFAGVLGAAGVTVIVLLAPWFAHRRTLPTTNEMQYFSRLSAGLLSEQLETLGWLVPHLASRMFREWREWGLQWWLLVAAAVTAPRRAKQPAQLFVLLEIAGGLAALVVAGMIAPAELHDHIGGSSHRYLIQLAPLAVLFAAGQWGDEGSGHG
jgi:hypothetical protein